MGTGLSAPGPDNSLLNPQLLGQIPDLKQRIMALSNHHNNRIAEIYADPNLTLHQKQQQINQENLILISQLQLYIALFGIHDIPTTLNEIDSLRQEVEGGMQRAKKLIKTRLQKIRSERHNQGFNPTPAPTTTRAVPAPPSGDNSLNMYSGNTGGGITEDEAGVEPSATSSTDQTSPPPSKLALAAAQIPQSLTKMDSPRPRNSVPTARIALAASNEDSEPTEEDDDQEGGESAGEDEEEKGAEDDNPEASEDTNESANEDNGGDEEHDENTEDNDNSHENEEQSDDQANDRPSDHDQETDQDEDDDQNREDNHQNASEGSEEDEPANKSDDNDDCP